MALKEDEFTVAKNISGVKLKARATGDLMSKNLNLEATLKRATALTAGSAGNASGGANAVSPSSPSDGGQQPSTGGNTPIDGSNGD